MTRLDDREAEARKEVVAVLKAMSDSLTGKSEEVISRLPFSSTALLDFALGVRLPSVKAVGTLVGYFQGGLGIRLMQAYIDWQHARYEALEEKAIEAGVDTGRKTICNLLRRSIDG